NRTRKATEHWKQACEELKHWDSCYQMGIWSQKKRKKKDAIKYLSMACDHENAEACNNLAVAYYNLKNMKKMQDSFKKACDLDLAPGCSNLAQYLRKNKQKPKAKKLYLKACKLGDKNACSVPKQIEKEIHLGQIDKTDLACSEGDAVACFNLTHLLLQDGRLQDAILASKLGCKGGDNLSCGYNAALSDNDAAFDKNIAPFVDTCAKKQASGCFYLACLYSLKDEIKLAANALHQAISLGFTKWDQIEKIAELKNLRASEKYQKLLKFKK
ncbi:MAG: TPR end-of-group domain-containing protein, partial [Bacteriovoracia bacterium]